jgi:rubredoxin
MAQQTMRGMRLGTQSLESEAGVVMAERNNFTYRCANGHETAMVFAAEAEVPQTWQCKICGLQGTLLEGDIEVILDESDEKTARTHWEMLLERRSLEELEEILQERLDDIRARREAAKASN